MLLLWTLISSSVLAQQPPASMSRPALSNMSSDAEISTTIALYTSFDLFKNTGLKPCFINSNKSADPTTEDFIVTREVSSQEEFCSFMAGTPIMIPTTPNRVAFFPWYPTMIIQCISLLVSYVGLFFILRRVDRSRNTGQVYSNPPWHWPLQAADLARAVAFAYSAAHGFSDPAHFAWLSPLYWLLPLNHVFVATQTRAVRQSAQLFAAAAATYEEPLAGAALQLRRHLRLRASQLLRRGTTGDVDAITPAAARKAERTASLRFTASSAGLPSLASVAGDYAGANGRRRSAPRGTAVWSWIVGAGAAWFVTLVVAVLHWGWAFPHPVPVRGGQAAGDAEAGVPSAALAAAEYAQVGASLASPQSIGNMPVSCLDFVSSGALLLGEGAAFFAKPSEDLPIFSILTTLQFILSTLTVLVGVYLLFIRRRTRPVYPQFVSTSPYAAAAFAHDEQLAQASASQRTKTLLLVSAGMTAFLLLLPAFALGMDIVAKVDRGGARVALIFTNDLKRTGGCTFAYVDMDKRAGYWDVPVGLGERVVMSLLGVA